MDNKEKILNEVGISDYRKGLYYSSDLELEYVSRIGNSKIFSFIVQSESNYYKNYNVRVTIENNEIKNTFCDCKQYKAVGSCKHLAASLIEFQDELFDNSTLTLEQFGNNILDLFKSSEEKVGIKKQAKIEIFIDVNENYYYHDTCYEVKFKIGDTKMYIANNKIDSFIDIYTDNSKNRELRFGKDFIYSNNSYYFNEEDKRIINYLKRNRELNFNRYLDDEDISNFISNIEGKEFTIDRYGKFNKIEKGSPYNIVISEKNGNYNLSITNLGNVFLFGANPTYAIYKDKIYELDNKILEFITIMNRNNIEEFEFSKTEINKFNNGLLKVIKDNVSVDTSLKDEIIICKKPQVRLYFDYYYNAICCNPVFLYNNNEISYFDNKDNVLRDITYENDIISDIMSYNFKLDKDKLIMDDINYIGEFIEEDLIKLTDKYEVFTSDKVKKTKIVKTNIRSSFGIGEDNILSYNFNLGNIDNKEINNILNDLKNKKKYYRLKSGDIINLEEDSNLNELNRLIEDMDISNSDIENGTGYIPKYRAIYLDSLKNSKYSIIDTNNLFDNFINNFNKYKDIDIKLNKEDLAILRDYQVIGVKWLYNIYKCELGSILADEMGLGKSIQFIYFIKQVLKEKQDAKILIVAPTSLIFNWEKEFEKFGSEISYKVIYGLKEKRRNDLSSLENINVIITTYGMIREDLDIYTDINFEVMAIDEAQNIKNIGTMVSKSVKKINAKVKFAITGTPLENSVLELWSIFDYIMPGYLTNVKTFQSKYNIKEVDEENLNKLNDLNTQIRPFILRRKKTDVLNDLPPKIENNIYIELNDKQKQIYMAEVEHTKKEMEEVIAEEGFTKGRFKILQLLTKLRQICIDPKIVYENYSYESSKIKQTVSLVKNIIANNHKILIFTSFKTALNILNKELINEGISTYIIDGEVNAKKRMELVDKFNTDDTNVFLITIKSGGTGLNLTSADVVIHLDLWWNPQVENQATDRSHRIGQKNTVEVIKLICKGTIEEKILELQNKKKILTDKLIEGENRDQSIISALTEEDIKSLFNMDNEEELQSNI